MSERVPTGNRSSPSVRAAPAIISPTGPMEPEPALSSTELTTSPMGLINGQPPVRGQTSGIVRPIIPTRILATQAQISQLRKKKGISFTSKLTAYLPGQSRVTKYTSGQTPIQRLLSVRYTRMTPVILAILSPIVQALKYRPSRLTLGTPSRFRPRHLLGRGIIG